MKPMLRLALACLFAAAPAGAGEEAAFDHTHPRFARVLSEHVRGGLVDYRGLKAQPGELNAYLDDMAGVTGQEFSSWAQEQQLAWLINLYNAATLALIVDHYPLKSIRDIGNLFKGPWKQPVVRLWGERVTLNRIEHDIIRKRYAVPEIHFALVCAAMGCPPLRGEPYVAGRLDGQLADQRTVFFGTPGKNEVDVKNRRVRLSPILKWYGEDFAAAEGSVIEYLAKHWPGVEEDFSVRYTDYDWSLNER